VASRCAQQVPATYVKVAEAQAAAANSKKATKTKASWETRGPLFVSNLINYVMK
jgi:hypothetical protein